MWAKKSDGRKSTWMRAWDMTALKNGLFFSKRETSLPLPLQCWTERDRKRSAVRDDVLWKGGGDSKEEERWHVQAGVFPGQSATNSYFAFQVFAYKRKAKNTSGNSQLAQSLGN